MEIVLGLGVMLAIGGGFRAVLAILTVRDRERSGDQTVGQARRGAVIYGSVAVVGIALATLGALL